MDRTSRYARCEAPTRSCTLSTTAANGHSQGDKETGEPDDATSIQSGSAGGWEKRPKGPRSQPTQLQCSKAGVSCVGFARLIRFPRRHGRGKKFGVLGSPTVSGRFLEARSRTNEPVRAFGQFARNWAEAPIHHRRSCRCGGGLEHVPLSCPGRREARGEVVVWAGGGERR